MKHDTRERSDSTRSSDALLTAWSIHGPVDLMPRRSPDTQDTEQRIEDVMIGEGSMAGKVVRQHMLM